MNVIQILGTLEISLIYSLVAIAVYLTFRVIDFPDLSVDGTFAMGAAICTALLIRGVDAYIAMFCTILGGGLAGYITAWLHVRYNISCLLSGIIVMTALYSINLRIMDAPNISIIDGTTTLFSDKSVLLIASIITGFILIATAFLLQTELGLAIRSSGINDKVSNVLGINVGKMKLLALAISNGIVAIAGAIFAQTQGFADISMGTGTIIIGLASVIIGETIFVTRNIFIILISCIIGTIIYRLIITLAINSTLLELRATDLNLITATSKTVTTMLKINKLNVTFLKNSALEHHALQDINLEIPQGEFVTIIGGNGAGKSTLLNAIAGNIPIDSVEIILDQKNISRLPTAQRAQYIARVFQDPMIGTCAKMTIEENLYLASKRGFSRTLTLSGNDQSKKRLQDLLAEHNTGLENRLTDTVALLSGGQRQVLGLIMTTLAPAKLLLLDEHTSALDPKSAKNVIELTRTIVQKYQLTALMITHSMTQALALGTRTMMMRHGKIHRDLAANTLQKLTTTDLLDFFELS